MEFMVLLIIHIPLDLVYLLATQMASYYIQLTLYWNPKYRLHWAMNLLLNKTYIA